MMLKKYFLLVFSALLLFASCDKFEEGGSLYASRSNIIGKWGYEKVVLNDRELSDALFDDHYVHSHIEFEKGSIVKFAWYNSNRELMEERTATYVFTYNKKKLCIVFDSYPLQEWQWEVKKLTRDEFWVEYAENDTCNYKMELIKLGNE